MQGLSNIGVGENTPTPSMRNHWSSSSWVYFIQPQSCREWNSFWDFWPKNFYSVWKGFNILDYVQIWKNLEVALPLQAKYVLSLPHPPPPLGSVTYICISTIRFCHLYMYAHLLLHTSNHAQACPQCNSCISWYTFHVTSSKMSVDTISRKGNIVYQGVLSSTNNACEVTGGPFWSTFIICVLSKEV